MEDANDTSDVTGSDVPDAPADVDDADPGDAGDDVAETGDVEDADTGDGGDGDGGDAGEGGLGDPCDTESDCAQPYCIDPIVDGFDDSFCTVPCVSEGACPEGFTCTLLPGSGSDAVSVCFPDTLCVDNDGDGYGVGPDCAGPDCDDSLDTVNPLADEVCDGIDNDCDTRVDDNPVGEGTECSTGFPGVCGAGRLTCTAGAPECRPVVSESAERCDGLDNDCDGATDEDDAGAPLTRSCYDGAAGTVGVGLCMAGTQTCASGEFGGCAGQVVPGTEICDFADNDCDGETDEGAPAPTWYRDVDGDGFGDAADPLVACTQPTGYVATSSDCNDAADDVFPGAIEVVGDGIDQDCDGVDLCWVDGDGDGFHAGVSARSTGLTCGAEGQLAAGAPDGDCDDANDEIHPDADEIAGDEVDQNCDGRELCFVDADNDGFRLETTVESPNVICTNNGEATAEEPVGDCNDAVATIYPGAPELCDGIDQNCNLLIDDDVETRSWWPDVDGDTWGDSAAEPVESCRAVAGSVDRNGDCNDGDDAIRPGATELPGDGVDQNCDGAEVCFADADLDGFRSGTVLVSDDADCDDEGEALASLPDGDCNDRNADVNPAATEVVADAIDNNCDGIELCYVDVDRDGYRPDAVSTVASVNLLCTDAGEAGASAPIGDCDDNDRFRNPGALELCDGVDQNCNDLIDDGITFQMWYPDTDADTFGAASAEGISSCSLVPGHVTNNLDCNDDRADVSPAAAEVTGDGFDQNCDGRETCFADSDDDGYRPNAAAVQFSLDADCDDPGEALRTDPLDDCNDVNPAVNPGATELVADAIDNNCDGIELCFVDADGDNWRPDAASTIPSPNLSCTDPGEADSRDGVGDCDDGNPAIFPTATEIVANGVDENCDARELCFADADNDGYRPNASATVVSDDLDCDDSGEATGADPVGDCDDTRLAVNPAATEVPDDGVDNNCDGFELCFRDADSDGYRPNAEATVLSPNLLCTDAGEARGAAPVGDCNDANSAVNPGALEIAADGVDQDCNGTELCFVDADDDGWRPNAEATVISPDLVCNATGEATASDPTGDCDDANAAVNPGAAEVAGDGFDQNCDGRETCFTDADDDGYRPNASATTVSLDTDCADSGEAIASDPVGDCNDLNSAVRPFATELPADSVDQDCDGIELCFVDADNDGWRPNDSDTVNSPNLSCTDPGEADSRDGVGDCNDANSNVNPGRAETPANGVDDNCDGVEACFADIDNDGYRPNASDTVTSLDLDCNDFGEAVGADPIGDCNDSVTEVNPGATELPDDGVDQNCDGVELCYRDGDDDGYRPNAAATVASTNLVCTDPGEARGSEPTGDCNDANSAINPGATEIAGDTIDQNCDGRELCFVDADNDGYRPNASATILSDDEDCDDNGEAVAGEPTGDCNDSNSAIRPGIAEVAGDGVDQNCDGEETCFVDADNDGYRPNASTTVSSADTDCNDAGEALSSEPTGDCNDADGTIRPGVAEITGDGVDQNCDGQEVCFIDADNDGYRPNASATVNSSDTDCNDSGEARSFEPTGDCNDSNGSINPGVNLDGDAYHACNDCNDLNALVPDGVLVTAGPAGLDVACDAFFSSCPDGTTEASIIFTGYGARVADVNVRVSISHDHIGDLKMWLVGPNGTSIQLFDRRGGSGTSMSGTLFDDEAATAISAGGSPFAGSFRPEVPLSGLDGITFDGTWKLQIQDFDYWDDGTLTAWSLEVDFACP